MKIGFDNKKYIQLQSENIMKRVEMFENKLYLELGGKLFDDHHASRVLPGFQLDAKIQVLSKLKDKLEILLCINASDIEKNKINSNVDLPYDMDVLRLIDNLKKLDFMVNNVVITLYKGQLAADTFRKKLERMGINVYLHSFTKGYPTDIDTIVSDEGYGANPYIETTRPLVIVAAPGPGSGKLATCLSQLYHEYRKGIKAGYAKYETFPIWNIPLKHPINMAYEAATADLKDVNMIDNFHFDAYNKMAINYNRDLEIYPVLKRILYKITGSDIYMSPTDMGVNMAGFAITNDEVCKEAAKQEILRRYYKSLIEYKNGKVDMEIPQRIKMLLDEANISLKDRKVVDYAIKKSEKEKVPALAIELENGKIITGKNTVLMTCAASSILNSLKELTKIDDDIKLISQQVLEPVLNFKKQLYGEERLLDLHDVLLSLNFSTATNPMAEKVLTNLKKLKGCEAHASHILSKSDKESLRQIGINLTEEAIFYSEKKD